MKLVPVIATVLLAVTMTAARSEDADPLSTMQKLMYAERALDLDRATGLFADDAVIVNAAGVRTAGTENLRHFIDEDMWFNESLELEQPRLEQNRVSWIESTTADFYRKLGVAPVRFSFTAVVDNGKIESIIAHVPREEIARMEAACGRTIATMIYGRPCSEHIRYLRHQTDAVDQSGTTFVKSGSRSEPHQEAIQ